MFKTKNQWWWTSAVSKSIQACCDISWDVMGSHETVLLGHIARIRFDLTDGYTATSNGTYSQ